MVFRCCCYTPLPAPLSICLALFKGYLLNCSPFCNKTWYGRTSSWVGMSCKIKWGAIFNVTVTVTACIIKHDCFYYIFLTNDSFATKLNVIVDHHKPKCSAKILDCCIQDQGDSKGSRFQLFVQMISSEMLILL